MTNSSINLARPSGLFLRVETLQLVDAVLSNPALREVAFVRHAAANGTEVGNT